MKDIQHALRNVQLGAMIVNWTDTTVDVWYGGCTVTILNTETGETVDVYNWREPPASLEEAIEQAIAVERPREEWEEQD